MRVFSDFDGTIAETDVTDLVLQRFAHPSWETIEAAWKSGEIDSATCMRRQIGLLQASRDDLDALLDSVALDPGFFDFLHWCEIAEIPVTVVSDGVDYFIRRILARHGLSYLPVFANELVFGAGGYALQTPWSSPACKPSSGVCKCAVLRDNNAVREAAIYIGDGRSDQCVSHMADIVFAKDSLATYRAAKALPFIPFETFFDVVQVMAVGAGSGSLTAVPTI